MQHYLAAYVAQKLSNLCVGVFVWESKKLKKWLDGVCEHIVPIFTDFFSYKKCFQIPIFGDFLNNFQRLCGPFSMKVSEGPFRVWNSVEFSVLSIIRSQYHEH